MMKAVPDDGSQRQRQGFDQSAYFDRTHWHSLAVRAKYPRPISDWFFTIYSNEVYRMKTGAWLAVGVAMGIALGAGMHNIGAGLAIGIALGAALAAATRRKKGDSPNDQI